MGGGMERAPRDGLGDATIAAHERRPLHSIRARESLGRERCRQTGVVLHFMHKGGGHSFRMSHLPLIEVSLRVTSRLARRSSVLDDATMQRAGRKQATLVANKQHQSALVEALKGAPP